MSFDIRYVPVKNLRSEFLYGKLTMVAKAIRIYRFYTVQNSSVSYSVMRFLEKRSEQEQVNSITFRA